MQVTGYYIHQNRSPSYVAFCKYQNLVKIYLEPSYDVALPPIVITYDKLVKIDSLYQYYIASLILTDKPYTTQYSPNGTRSYTENKWCILSKCDWKRMHYDTSMDFYIGWETDPMLDVASFNVTPNKQWKCFHKKWIEFAEYNSNNNDHYYPYIPQNLCLLDEIWYKLVGCYVDYIEQHLDIIEDELLQTQREIEKYSLIYSHFGIPIHILGLIMNSKVS